MRLRPRDGRSVGRRCHRQRLRATPFWGQGHVEAGLPRRQPVLAGHQEELRRNRGAHAAVRVNRTRFVRTRTCTRTATPSRASLWISRRQGGPRPMSTRTILLTLHIAAIASWLGADVMQHAMRHRWHNEPSDAIKAWARMQFWLHDRYYAVVALLIF